MGILLIIRGESYWCVTLIGITVSPGVRQLMAPAHPASSEVREFCVRSETLSHVSRVTVLSPVLWAPALTQRILAGKPLLFWFCYQRQKWLRLLNSSQNFL